MTRTILATALGALAIAACTTTGGTGRGGIDVTRYHLGAPIAAGTVAVESAPAPGAIIGPESSMYADAVRAELGRIGFAAAPPESAQYIAAVSFLRASRGTVRTPPKFSIGIGGGGYSGGGVGLGGGISTGIGSKTREVLASELRVAIRRRSDGTVIWEGRAQTTALSGRPDTQPAAMAGRLANAVFRGFPGESGITISVP